MEGPLGGIGVAGREGGRGTQGGQTRGPRVFLREEGVQVRPVHVQLLQSLRHTRHRFRHASTRHGGGLGDPGIQHGGRRGQQPVVLAAVRDGWGGSIEGEGRSRRRGGLRAREGREGCLEHALFQPNRLVLHPLVMRHHLRHREGGCGASCCPLLAPSRVRPPPLPAAPGQGRVDRRAEGWDSKGGEGLLQVLGEDGAREMNQGPRHVNICARCAGGPNVLGRALIKTPRPSVAALHHHPVSPTHVWRRGQRPKDLQGQDRALVQASEHVPDAGGVRLEGPHHLSACPPYQRPGGGGRRASRTGRCPSCPGGPGHTPQAKAHPVLIKLHDHARVPPKLRFHVLGADATIARFLRPTDPSPTSRKLVSSLAAARARVAAALTATSPTPHGPPLFLPWAARETTFSLPVSTRKRSPSLLLARRLPWTGFGRRAWDERGGSLHRLQCRGWDGCVCRRGKGSLCRGGGRRRRGAREGRAWWRGWHRKGHARRGIDVPAITQAGHIPEAVARVARLNWAGSRLPVLVRRPPSVLIQHVVEVGVHVENLQVVAEQVRRALLFFAMTFSWAA
jgi:hypothetical protein